MSATAVLPPRLGRETQQHPNLKARPQAADRRSPSPLPPPDAEALAPAAAAMRDDARRAQRGREEARDRKRQRREERAARAPAGPRRSSKRGAAAAAKSKLKALQRSQKGQDGASEGEEGEGGEDGDGDVELSTSASSSEAASLSDEVEEAPEDSVVPGALGREAASRAGGSGGGGADAEEKRPRTVEKKKKRSPAPRRAAGASSASGANDGAGCFVKEPLDARVAEALFSQLDGGGKGYITAGDVQRVAAFFNLSIPRHVLHDMVQLFAGPSGKLAKADFQKLVQ